MLQSIEKRETLSSQARRQIRNAIITGALEPGSMHSEQSIASQMAISRTPVREALLDIAREGLVEFVPQRGVRIVPVNADHLVAVLEYRAALEGYCAAVAASRDDPALIAALHGQLDRQKEIIAAGDSLVWVEANIGFHSALVQSLANELINQTFSSLAAHTMRIGYRMIESGRERMAGACEEHAAIVEAIEQRQPEKARRLAESHLHVTNDLMIKLFDELGFEASERARP